MHRQQRCVAVIRQQSLRTLPCPCKGSNRGSFRYSGDIDSTFLPAKSFAQAAFALPREWSNVMNEWKPSRSGSFSAPPDSAGRIFYDKRAFLEENLRANDRENCHKLNQNNSLGNLTLGIFWLIIS
jgi:hypothetical protein